MEIDEAVCRVRGLDKPGVWKYTPRFIALPIVKKIKDAAGVNRLRRHNLNLRKSVGDVRDAYHRTLGTIFLGANSFCGLSGEEKADIYENVDIDGALMDERDGYRDSYRRVAEQRDELRERVFEMDMDKLIKDGGFRHSSLMIYNAGDVLYATPEFKKRFGRDWKSLGEGLWKDKFLNEELVNRRVVETVYEGRNLKFVPCRGDGDRNLALAYIDYKHGKDNLNSLRAIRAINHYLNEFDLGMMGTESKERAAIKEAECIKAEAKHEEK